jgi:glycosyltransferase involved in cell wall biosynthesis
VRNENCHIAFVLSSFFPDRSAGTERYVYNLAKGLLDKGFQVSIVIPTTEKKEPYVYRDIRVYPYQVNKKIDLKEEYSFKGFTGRTEFMQIMDEIQPKIVHFHTILSRTIPVSLALELSKKGTEVLVTPHLGGFFCLQGDFQEKGKKACDGAVSWRRCGSCYFGSRNPVLDPVFELAPKELLSRFFSLFGKGGLVSMKRETDLKALRESNIQFVAIAHWIQKVFLANQFKDVHLISQGIAASKSENNARTVSQKLHLLFVGRLNPSKGLDILLTALESLKIRRDFDIQCLVIPDPTEMNYLSEMKSKVEALGGKWAENADVKEVGVAMAENDVLVVPSRSNEMAPLVILEAIQHTLPVLGSTYPAVQEMISENSAGWLFNNGDIQDLRRMLLGLLEDKKKVAEVRNQLKPVRNTQNVVEDHMKVYHKILEQ